MLASWLSQLWPAFRMGTMPYAWALATSDVSGCSAYLRRSCACCGSSSQSWVRVPSTAGWSSASYQRATSGSQFSWASFKTWYTWSPAASAYIQSLHLADATEKAPSMKMECNHSSSKRTLRKAASRQAFKGSAKRFSEKYVEEKEMMMRYD